MNMMLHLVSDSIGSAVSEVAKGCKAQFSSLEFQEKNWFMIRSDTEITNLLEDIRQNPGIVLASLVNRDHQKQLKEACSRENIPYISVTEDLIHAIEQFSGEKAERRIGAQYKMDDAYFSRIHAMDYTLAHDDSKSLETAHLADILLFGVSRTSKTPTSIYLARQGYKVANIPILSEPIVPESLDLSLVEKPPFIVGLTIDANRLSSVRDFRTVHLVRGAKNLHYTDYDSIKEEIQVALRFFQRHNYPFIDVTYRSIEETATEILRLYHVQHQK